MSDSIHERFGLENVAAVMPAYNEAACIEQVVREWLDVVSRLIVVNDGSRDETGAILDRLATECPGLCVIHQKNAGHGAALLNGYRTALENGTDWIFQTDSDGQFVAEDFWLLWERRQSADFLLGERASRDDHPVRIRLSRVHAMLLRILFGTPVQDPNVPFRLMKAARMQEYLEKIPQGTFAPNVFLTILASRDRITAGAIPVRHRARQTGEVSIRGWKTLKIGLLVFRQLLAFRKSLRNGG